MLIFEPQLDADVVARTARAVVGRRTLNADPEAIVDGLGRMLRHDHTLTLLQRDAGDPDATVTGFCEATGFDEGHVAIAHADDADRSHPDARPSGTDGH